MDEPRRPVDQEFDDQEPPALTDAELEDDPEGVEPPRVDPLSWEGDPDDTGGLADHPA